MKMGVAVAELWRRVVKASGPVTPVVIVVPRAGLSDQQLYEAMAVAPGHPVLRGVTEILDRLEDEQVQEYSRPDVPREVKADAMAAIGILREVRMQVESHRANAPAALEQLRAKQDG